VKASDVIVLGNDRAVTIQKVKHNKKTLSNLCQGCVPCECFEQLVATRGRVQRCSLPPFPYCARTYVPADLSEKFFDMGFGSKWWDMSKTMVLVAGALVMIAHAAVYVWPHEEVSGTVKPLFGLWPYDVFIVDGWPRYLHFLVIIGAGALLVAVGLPLRHFSLKQIENPLYPRMKLYWESASYTVAGFVLQAAVPIQSDFDLALLDRKDRIYYFSTRFHFFFFGFLLFSLLYHGYSMLVLMHYSTALPCTRETAEPLFRRRCAIIGTELVSGLGFLYLHPLNPFFSQPLEEVPIEVKLEGTGPALSAIQAIPDTSALARNAMLSTVCHGVRDGRVHCKRKWKCYFKPYACSWRG